MACKGRPSGIRSGLFTMHPGTFQFRNKPVHIFETGRGAPALQDRRRSGWVQAVSPPRGLALYLPATIGTEEAMQHLDRRALLAAGALLPLAARTFLPRAAGAQGTWPEKPVRIIVPFPPG